MPRRWPGSWSGSDRRGRPQGEGAHKGRPYYPVTLEPMTSTSSATTATESSSSAISSMGWKSGSTGSRTILWPRTGLSPSRSEGLHSRTARRARGDPRGRRALSRPGGGRRARTQDDALADDGPTAANVRNPGPRQPHDPTPAAASLGHTDSLLYVYEKTELICILWLNTVNSG